MREKGYIMLESLVGVAILAIAVLYVMSTFGMRLTFDRRNAIRAQAYYLAEQGIEKVRANPAGIPSEFPTEDFGQITGFPNYRREYSFQQVPTTGPATIWEVRVRIKWRKDSSSTPWDALELVSYVTQ